MPVRELPPLRLSYAVETPSGRRYRWAPDEPNGANVPSGIRFSSTAPGGYENFDGTLPRKPGVDFGDLERLSTIRAIGAGGAVAWEGRLERAPRTSGDQMAVTPSAVGWQAHLDDDKSITEVYIDRDIGAWGEAPMWWKLDRSNAGWATGKIALSSTEGLVFDFPNQALANNEYTDAWYAAPAGCQIARIYYEGLLTGAFSTTETPTAFTTDSTSAPITADSTTLTFDDTLRTTPLTAHRYAFLRAKTTGAWTPAAGVQMAYKTLYLIGNHGVTLRTDSDGYTGFYASDIVANAVGRGAPLLAYTTGSTGTIQPSSFVVDQLTFKDPTTASEIVKEVSRYGLEDWFVWDNKTFWWHDRGAYGRSWRARVGPAQLEETGPAVDRIWESIIVQYQDVDGSAKTVGPPGSGADTETVALKDSDPENPANQLGIIRRDLLQMGVSTPARATQLGQVFLNETKRLDSSGRARIVGHVQDDRGVLHPYWRVRAGDTITFVDSNDTSARRIVRVEHDVDALTASVDLDAPPDALPALLARLGVVLVPLGL